jgi:hypothetical protein
MDNKITLNGIEYIRVAIAEKEIVINEGTLLGALEEEEIDVFDVCSALQKYLLEHIYDCVDARDVANKTDESRKLMLLGALYHIINCN